MLPGCHDARDRCLRSPHEPGAQSEGLSRSFTLLGSSGSGLGPPPPGPAVTTRRPRPRRGVARGDARCLHGADREHDDRSTTDKKVRICHATSSESNPYVSNEPAIANNGDLRRPPRPHRARLSRRRLGRHHPAVRYVDENGQTQTFPGKLDRGGQAIWQNGCEPPPPPTPRPTDHADPRVRRADRQTGFLAHFGYDNPNRRP